MLQTVQAVISGIGHEPENFPDRIIFASMFKDITIWESPNVRSKCLDQAEEVANCAARFKPGYW